MLKKVNCSKGHKLEGDNAYTRPSGRIECRTCIASKQRDRYRENESYRNWMKERQKGNIKLDPTIRVRKRVFHNNLKSLVLSAYSSDGIPICCVDGCGVTDIDMLTLDHVKNNGGEHRRELGANKIYRWARDNNYPDELQVMCWNHNIKKEYTTRRQKALEGGPYYGQRVKGWIPKAAPSIGEGLKYPRNP